jgi:hypothetical protein
MTDKKDNPIKSTGRHTDPTPVSCTCGWTGKRMEAIHTYKKDGYDDVEPVDLCPQCKKEEV